MIRQSGLKLILYFIYKLKFLCYAYPFTFAPLKLKSCVLNMPKDANSWHGEGRKKEGKKGMAQPHHMIENYQGEIQGGVLESLHSVMTS